MWPFEGEQESLKIDLAQYGVPYKNQWDLMREYMIILDLFLYYFYRHHQWTGPQNHMHNMLGLAVTREEFEARLVKAADCIVGMRLSAEEQADRNALIAHFFSRIEATAQAGLHENKVVDIYTRFSLDRFSALCFF